MESHLRRALSELVHAIDGLNAHSDDPTSSREQVYQLTTQLDQWLAYVCAALEHNSEVCKREGFDGEADRLDFHVRVCVHVINMNKDAMIGYTIGRPNYSEKLHSKFAMMMKVNQIIYEYDKERPEPLHPDPEYLAELDGAVRKWEAVVGGLRKKFLEIFDRVSF